MTEFHTGRGSHLMVWAMAEAHRLRREAVSPSPDATPVEPADAEATPGPIDTRDGLVVEWQLPPASACRPSF